MIAAVAAVAGEGAAHLDGVDPIGEVGGDAGTGTDPDVDVQGVDVEPCDRLLEGAQGTDLVDRALRPTARERDTDAGRGGVAHLSRRRP